MVFDWSVDNIPEFISPFIKFGLSHLKVESLCKEANMRVNAKQNGGVVYEIALVAGRLVALRLC